MKKQIVRISPLQTAKVFAAVYFVIALPFGLLMLVPTLLSVGPTSPPLGFLILTPFLYALLGFAFSAIGAAIYNWVARFIGGIEYVAIDVPEPTAGAAP